MYDSRSTMSSNDAARAFVFLDLDVERDFDRPPLELRRPLADMDVCCTDDATTSFYMQRWMCVGMMRMDRICRESLQCNQSELPSRRDSINRNAASRVFLQSPCAPQQLDG